MNQDKPHCKAVQPLITAAQPLTPGQLEHVADCQQCATLQVRMQQLDQLVNRATADLVPAGFNQRLMARLSREAAVQTQTAPPVGDKLLALFSHSRLLRTIAISLGMALGIGQLVQLILGIFFVSVMAAM